MIVTWFAMNCCSLVIARRWSSLVGLTLVCVIQGQVVSAQGLKDASGTPIEPATVKPPVTAIAVSPDGNVVVGSQAGIELLDGMALVRLHAVPTELTHVHDLAFSPDGKILAAVGGDPSERGSVELIEWPSQKVIRRIHPHQDLVYAVAWQSNSAGFAIASADHTVSIHPLDASKPSITLNGHSRGVLAVAFLSREGDLLTAGIDESIRLWQVTKDRPARTFTNHTRPVNGLAVRPALAEDEPAVVASISEDRTVRLWQPTIGRMVRFARLPSAPSAICWSADGQTLFVACKDGHMRALDAETMSVTRDQPVLEGVAYCLALTPDKAVLVGGHNGQVRRVSQK